MRSLKLPPRATLPSEGVAGATPRQHWARHTSHTYRPYLINLSIRSSSSSRAPSWDACVAGVDEKGWQGVAGVTRPVLARLPSCHSIGAVWCGRGGRNALFVNMFAGVTTRRGFP
jgi:hypothetical protein